MGKVRWSELWKKYKFVLLVVLVGVILMVLPVSSESKETETSDLQTPREAFDLAETEQRMEAILSKIDGVGKLQLMLTLQSGTRLTLAEDTQSDSGRTNRETLTLNRGSGSQEVVVTNRYYPVYQGAVVVCQGADSSAVRLAITETVAGPDRSGLRSDSSGKMDIVTGGHGMEKVWKKRAVVGAVLLFVCAAVYMNRRCAGSPEDTFKVPGESTPVSGENQPGGQTDAAPTQATAAEDDYFATARLSRKQARDNAISMLKDASVDENADQSVLNEASQTLQVLAAYTVAESQIENLVTAKGYADCVAFMGAESISVVVDDADGLDAQGCGPDR
ncbi:MAG: SpoIIIAH-like family protein [Oscillospiraceae bacterium]